MKILALAAALFFASPTYATTVLFVGDSHSVGSFGQTLDALLRAVPGNEVATYASCGTHPASWYSGAPTHCGYWQKNEAGQAQRGLTAPTPLILDLLKQTQPNVTIVALGANMLDAPDSWITDTAARMAHDVAASGSRCIWVGNPDTRLKTHDELLRFEGVLKAAVTPSCEFIDSLQYTHYPAQGGDGVHYDQLGPAGSEMARAWARSVFDDLSKIMR